MILVPDIIVPEKFLGYSRESNPGPLGWQSDVLTTVSNRRSKEHIIENIYHMDTDNLQLKENSD